MSSQSTVRKEKQHGHLSIYYLIAISQLKKNKMRN